MRSFLLRQGRLARVSWSVTAAMAVATAMVWAQSAGAPLVVVNLLLFVPAAVQAVLVPTARRRLYRWVVLWVLTQLIHPAATAPVIVAGIAWCLWRVWVDHPDLVTPSREPAAAAVAGQR